MNEAMFFKILLYTWFIIGVPIFIALFFVKAPYGRYARKGWGPLVGKQLAWILMEAPSFIVFAVFFFLGDFHNSLVSWLFFFLWEAHYLHRAFIYPLQLRGTAKQMPLSIIIFSIFFNLINCYLNARWLFQFSGGYPERWYIDFRFILGVALFIIGYVINRQADLQLRKLRQPGENTYKVPQGGLFNLIASPNYFGEIIEWTGWAMATWSLAGLSFAFWTFVNLAPRAWSHLMWYQKTFPEYPDERRALLPWLW